MGWQALRGAPRLDACGPRTVLHETPPLHVLHPIRVPPWFPLRLLQMCPPVCLFLRSGPPRRELPRFPPPGPLPAWRRAALPCHSSPRRMSMRAMQPPRGRRACREPAGLCASIGYQNRSSVSHGLAYRYQRMPNGLAGGRVPVRCQDEPVPSCLACTANLPRSCIGRQAPLGAARVCVRCESCRTPSEAGRQPCR